MPRLNNWPWSITQEIHGDSQLGKLISRMLGIDTFDI
jgi:hypothetical protein